MDNVCPAAPAASWCRPSSPRPWNDRGIWILLLLPVILLLLNDRWAVTPPGTFDPWAYYGQYRNFRQHQMLFGCTYNAGRLSVIVPGYLAHQLLPSVAANYALRLGLYYAAVVSIYLILCWTVSRRMALLATVCLGCQFFFLIAVGWNYVDGFGIAYFCLTALALTAAARFGFWKVYLGAAGAGAAALVVANPVFVILLPYLVVHYYFFNRHGLHNSLSRSVLLFAIGGMALLLACSLVSWWAVGRFWFLLPTLRYIMQTGQPPVVPSFDWLPRADWLVLAAVTLATTAISICAARVPLRQRPTQVFYQLQFLALLALFAIGQLRGLGVVQYSFYFSLIMPATILSLSATVAPYVARMSPAAFRASMAAVMVILLAPHLTQGSASWLSQFRSCSAVLPAVLGAFGLVIAYVVGARAWVAPLLAFIFFAFPTYVANNLFCPDQWLRRTGNSEPQAWKRIPPQAVLGAVTASIDVIRKWDHAGQGRFWYNARAPLGDVFTATCASYFWQYRLVNEDFPAIRDRTVFTALKHQRLWLLSAEPDALARAQEALETVDLQARLIAKEVINASSVVAYTLYYVAILPRDVRVQPQIVRTSAGTGVLVDAESGDGLSLPAKLWALVGPAETHSWKRFFRCRGSLHPSELGLDVATGDGCYALAYAPLTVEREGDYRFEVKYTLRRGLIGLGVLNEDQGRWLGQSPGQRPIPVQEPGVFIASCTVHLKDGEICHLMLTNNRFDGVSSQAVIHELRAFREVPRIVKHPPPDAQASR